MKKSRRRAISMREDLYFALRLYTERLNDGVPEKQQTSITTVNSKIILSEVPPIPSELIQEGKEMVERASNFDFTANRFESARVFSAVERQPPKVMKTPLSKGEPIDEFTEDPVNPSDEFYSGTMKL